MSSSNPDTRTRILKSTLMLLETSNGKQVRMTDIAKEAGITRQALYLHFSTRAELLIETTFYLDRLKNTDEHLKPSRAATSGVERLNAYIDAWTSYLPHLYGLARAMMSMKDTDEAAAKAWGQRMQDMREGCEAAILALKRDNQLRSEFTPDEATDLFWTLMSVRNWEQMTIESGWTQEKYVKAMKSMATRNFIKESETAK